MKKLLKVFGIILAVVVVLLIAGFVYFSVTFPDVNPPAIVKVESTPALIARGEYLANHVAVCVDCHSIRDWSKYAGPIKPETFSSGGEVFDENMGMPGKIYSKNITPAGLENWTDGELIRAITCGVNKDNTALFPIMPYPNYNKLTNEDLYSIVAYVRSLKPIKNEVPETKLNFPLNFIVKTIPIKNHNPMKFDRTNPKEYGKYLVTMASCGECHTPAEKGEPLPGMDFAGGNDFAFPFGTVRSMNITPDNETGIGQWTKETFIKRFKDFVNDSSLVHPVSESDFNTPMPWIMYAGMTEEDLGAIYDYLRTLKPVNNRVERFTKNN